MSQANYISRKALNLFSNNELDLIYNQEKLKDFIGLPFSIENIEKQIELKNASFSSAQRDTLCDVLYREYKNFENNNISLEQIDRLRQSNTYTITTGHQLCLLGGPMYFFLKIIHVIKLTRVLNKKFPDFHFIPVFWMASEDHDSKEIDYLNLFNKKVEWKHDQSGAVGRFNTQNLDEVFTELTALFSDEIKEELKEQFKSFQGNSYSDAFRNWLHYIFSDKGLIIIDADRKELKELFKPVLRNELLHSFSNECVQNTNKELEKSKRKIQAHSRELNLFYLEKDTRIRILKKDKDYSIGQKTLNQTEMMELLDNEAVNFSPNVVLRPVYQETILPNLCYVGGMAELNYWMQLKGAFQASSTCFPIIQLRSNLLWIDKTAQNRINKLEMELNDVFKDVKVLKQEYLTRNDLQPFNEQSVNDAVKSIESSVKEALDGHKGLDKWMESEIKKLNQLIEKLENRISKEKRKAHDQNLIQIEKIKEKLFPNGNLQERFQNLLHFCTTKGYKQRLDDLFESIDPLNNDFTILIEEHNESK